MSKTIVTKEITFDCAHYLPDYSGDCKNIHGHTYKLQVSVSRRNFKAERDNMLIDFKSLSGIIKDKIGNCLDHAFITFQPPPQILPQEDCGDRQRPEPKNLYAFLDEMPIDFKTYEMSVPSTAENLVEEIYRLLFQDIENLGCYIYKITLWETPTSFAEVFFE